MVKQLGMSDVKLAGCSAMAGPMDGRKALAALVLWNSGHFDTHDIHQVLDVLEDAVYRTLHAARHVARGGE